MYIAEYDMETALLTFLSLGFFGMILLGLKSIIELLQAIRDQ
ncbi:MAG: hypothetical protein UMR38_02915 [Candidatus Izemoplasma sp.]|nr:hypothetical protein [Candidatus Izemoplasma sp.]